MLSLPAIDWLIITLITLAGAGWRWTDGRGIPPGQTAIRNIIGGLIAVPALWPIIDNFGPGAWWWLGLTALIVSAVIWASMWTPRQKQREEIDDMLLRWAAPITAYGIVLSLILLDLRPGIILIAVGLLTSALVWEGARYGWTPFRSRWLDGSALADIVIGSIAFGGLSLAVRL